jgi:hypothetical protein
MRGMVVLWLSVTLLLGPLRLVNTSAVTNSSSVAAAAAAAADAAGHEDFCAPTDTGECTACKSCCYHMASQDACTRCSQEQCESTEVNLWDRVGLELLVGVLIPFVGRLLFDVVRCPCRKCRGQTPEYRTCLDRQFVQKEVGWARASGHFECDTVITVYEPEEKRHAFFDYGRASGKYQGGPYEDILAIDAIEYRRDTDEAEAMVARILKRAKMTRPKASVEPINSPGSWDFFLSHGQASAGDAVKVLCMLLRKRNKADGQPYTVWYDNEMGSRSVAAMEEGVRHSANFLIFLSSDSAPDRKSKNSVSRPARSYSGRATSGNGYESLAVTHGFSGRGLTVKQDGTENRVALSRCSEIKLRCTGILPNTCSFEDRCQNKCLAKSHDMYASVSRDEESAISFSRRRTTTSSELQASTDPHTPLADELDDSEKEYYFKRYENIWVRTWESSWQRGIVTGFDEECRPLVLVTEGPRDGKWCTDLDEDIRWYNFVHESERLGFTMADLISGASSWSIARDRNQLSPCAAVALAAARLLCWHNLQPVMYFVALMTYHLQRPLANLG